MPRTRISTTVDAELLARARTARSGVADSRLIDEALRALLARQRAAEIDASYVAYDTHPLDEADAWGDLASFRAAAGES
jgi:hypothetical protein